MRQTFAVVITLIASCGIASSADNERVVVQSRDVVQPVQSKPFNPDFPPQLLAAGVSGSVIVKYIITFEGRAKDVSVVDSMPKNIFDDAALAEVRKTTWTPGTIDGRVANFQKVSIIEFDADRQRGVRARSENLSTECKQALKCASSPSGCMTIGVSNDGQCGIECAMDLRRELMNSGIPARVPHPTGGASRKDGLGCIGFRPELGGNEAGAACIARVLGNRFEVGACGKDGWPYSVRTY